MNYFGRIKKENGVVVEKQIVVLNVTADDISDKIMRKLQKDVDVPSNVPKTDPFASAR